MLCVKVIKNIFRLRVIQTIQYYFKQCSGSMIFLVWIRICRSMPLTKWTRIQIFLFCHWPSRCQQKNNFFKSFFAYYFLKVHLRHFSKIKSPKKSLNCRNQGFSFYFCLLIKDSDPYLELMDPGGPKRCGSGRSRSGYVSGSGTLDFKHMIWQYYHWKRKGSWIPPQKNSFISYPA